MDPRPQHRPERSATRSSLLCRLRNPSDQESWTVFYGHYAGPIRGFALRAGLTETEADEVVQETMLTVAGELPEFRYDRSKGSFKGWLFHTARWRIQDQFRKRPLTLEVSSPRDESNASCGGVQAADPAGSPLEAVWDQEWRQHLVDRALESLRHLVSEEQFQIFHLYAVKGLSVRSVAAALGVSATQVYLAKHRVGRVFKQEIRRLTQCE